jgi:hypothetical protein
MSTWGKIKNSLFLSKQKFLSTAFLNLDGNEIRKTSKRFPVEICLLSNKRGKSHG